MTKLPRDISGKQLINKLKHLGYITTRQIGSHIRLSTEQNGTHHITIPNHNPLKIGTLSKIIKEVAFHFEVSKGDIINRLF